MTEYLTTGQSIVRSLVGNGVETIFGIPGAHTYDFYDALYQKKDKIRHIVTRHEQAAGYMAYGYAKSSGKAGVYSVVPGPGVLNSGAALCTAYGANAPVMCVTAEIPSAMIGQGRGILHELPDQLATMRSITKWSGRINHPTEASSVMHDAFQHMLSGRQGPVAIETPWDIVGSAAQTNLFGPVDAAATAPVDSVSLEAAVALIKEARNPMITVGGGAVHAGAEVMALAELLQAPVAAHRSGKGIVSEQTPYGFNCASAYKLWPDTDLLIGIGSRLELQYLRWRVIPDGLKVIRIDIDPTEMVRLQPDVGLVCDAKDGTAALVEAIAGVGARPSRVEEFTKAKQESLAEIEKIQPQIDYLKAIRRQLPRDGFFVEEISQVGFTARYAMPVYEPRHYVTCGYQDNLGFGYMTALGVKVAHPDKAVVSVSGDGGFMYGVQELATAKQHDIGVIAIVFNNRAYGNVLRDQQTKYQGHVCGAELENPDFVRLAESFGLTGYSATTPDELNDVLATAIAADAPCVIEVQGERGGETSPWEFLMPNGM